MKEAVSGHGSPRLAMLWSLLVLAVVSGGLAFAHSANATTLNYCTNVTLYAMGTPCNGSRHSYTYNSGTATSPTNGYVCENVKTSTGASGYVNSWKCATNFVSRSYGGSHLYVPYISNNVPKNTGGASMPGKFSGSARY